MERRQCARTALRGANGAADPVLVAALFLLARAPEPAVQEAELEERDHGQERRPPAARVVAEVHDQRPGEGRQGREHEAQEREPDAPRQVGVFDQVRVVRDPAIPGSRLFKDGTQALFCRGPVIYGATLA